VYGPGDTVPVRLPEETLDLAVDEIYRGIDLTPPLAH
jgi:hypothetical protein